MASGGPTWLYQAFCEHGALLYVGIAVDLERRIQQHRATKLWWPGVDYVAAGRYPTRDEAARVELKIIRGALPPRNIAGKPGKPSWPLTSTEWHLVDARGHAMET